MEGIRLFSRNNRDIQVIVTRLEPKQVMGRGMDNKGVCANFSVTHNGKSFERSVGSKKYHFYFADFKPTQNSGRKTPAPKFDPTIKLELDKELMKVGWIMIASRDNAQRTVKVTAITDTTVRGVDFEVQHNGNSFVRTFHGVTSRFYFEDYEYDEQDEEEVTVQTILKKKPVRKIAANAEAFQAPYGMGDVVKRCLTRTGVKLPAATQEEHIIHTAEIDLDSGEVSYATNREAWIKHKHLVLMRKADQRSMEKLRQDLRAELEDDGDDGEDDGTVG